MKKISIQSSVGLLGLSFSTLAMGSWLVPFSDMSFFMGIGASYNSVKLDQNLILTSYSDVITANVIVATGRAGGGASPFHQTQSTYAPLVQLGYAWSFCPDWSAGIKFSYQYLNITASEENIYLPQSAQLSATPAGLANTYNANVTIQSAQTMINHQFALLAFVERSYMQNNVYLGIGPALLGTEFNINNAVAFTDINGVHNDVTGLPVSLANDKWLWGVAVQLGITKYLDPTWYVDLNYTYALTDKHSNLSSAAYTSQENGFFSTGSLFVNTSQRITSQGVALTINKEFSV